MDDPLTLYGVPHSLYAGKVRAYLRKQQIAYRERPPTDAHFVDTILPLIGRRVIPVVELADGTVIQDSVEIIDHFEPRGVRLTAYPTGPRQLAVAHVLELYAVVGLLRHAMHYRWSYLAQQKTFLTDAFTAARSPDQAASAMARMQSYLPMLGVNAKTIPAIEASYGELLAHLDGHFAQYPYLLGHRPSVGDYAMFGPLFAHLGRDPVPLAIMQNSAPRVYRWIERMNAPDLDTVEFSDTGSGFLADDQIPPSLGPLLNQIALEIIPDLIAQRDWIGRFAQTGAAIPGQPVSDSPHPVIGDTESSFRGRAYRGDAQPYLLFLWQRLLSASRSQAARQLLSDHGLSALIDRPLPMSVERHGYVEHWAMPAE